MRRSSNKETLKGVDCEICEETHWNLIRMTEEGRKDNSDVGVYKP